MELHPKVAQALEEIDAQIFSGDISDPEILEKLKGYVFAWVRRISSELPENPEDWTSCPVCDGTGKSPADKRERCKSRRGLFGDARCNHPSGHTTGHFSPGGGGGRFSIGWSTDEKDCPCGAYPGAPFCVCVRVEKLGSGWIIKRPDYFIENELLVDAQGLIWRYGKAASGSSERPLVLADENEKKPETPVFSPFPTKKAAEKFKKAHGL